MFLDRAAIPARLPEWLTGYLRSGVARQLREAALTMTTDVKGAAPNDQLYWAPLLLCIGAISALSCVVARYERGRGQQFKDCVRKHYPWDQDAPEGLSQKEATAALYDLYRNPFIHAGGFHVENDLSRFGVGIVKVGRTFSGLQEFHDAAVGAVLNFTKPTLSAMDGRVVLWLEQFYCATNVLVFRAIQSLSELEDAGAFALNNLRGGRPTSARSGN